MSMINEFIWTQYLKEHKHIHTDEKPFTCDVRVVYSAVKQHSGDICNKHWDFN